MADQSLFNKVFILGSIVILFSCKAKDDYPGLEYAPNMYHSVPYEPLSQIQDESAGMWLSNRADGKGEYFNTNLYNPHNMNMRQPVEGTVRRTESGFLPYHIPKDSFDLAARVLTNPLDSTKAILDEGEVLYSRFCSICHGPNGQGDGKVGEVIKGVPAYNVGRVKDLPEGHIFHVITNGKGRMGSYASQLNMEERWKIVRYIQVLQNQDNS